MFAWFKGIWTVVKASSWLASALKIGALVVGALVTVAVILGRAKKAGRDEVKLKQRDEALGHVKERHNVEDSVRREPDPAGRLRDKWSRD